MIREATDVAATAERLRPVLLRLSRELRKETEALGVTGSQATLLWHVREHPGLTLRELAALERISAPSLSGHVDRLERAGLLERVRSTGDRRRVELELTPVGSRLLRRIRARRTTWLAERLSTLEPDQVEAIEQAIGSLAALLHEERA
jgi:DNA-binding MarR family transcriptional regulator